MAFKLVMALTKLGLASFPSQTEPFRVPLIRRKVGAAALGENSRSPAWGPHGWETSDGHASLFLEWGGEGKRRKKEKGQEQRPVGREKGGSGEGRRKEKGNRGDPGGKEKGVKNKKAGKQVGYPRTHGICLALTGLTKIFNATPELG